MAYLGRGLDRGNYLKLDDISSQFNGSSTTFNLTSGGQAFYPGSVYSILVSLSGVVQEPVTAYLIDRNQITFAAAPLASDTFFCVALGVALGVGVPGEATVSGSKLSQPFNYDDGVLYLDPANNRVGIGTTIPQQTLHVVGSGSTTLLVSGNARVTGILTVGSSSVTVDGNNNQVNVGTAVTITNSGFLIGSSNLHSTGLSASSINVSGVGTFASLSVSGNVSIAGTVTYDDVTNVDSIGIITARTGVRITDGGLVVTAGVSTFASQIQSTQANSTTDGGGQIYLNGATGNRIDFNINGVAAPTFTTRSAGTKIVLYPDIGGARVDFALGIENNTLWSSVSNSAQQFKWYAGTTNIATLFGTGELVLGTTTKTGTASQPLQVTGGAYVSGSVGIGTTNPGDKLHVEGGNIRIQNPNPFLTFSDTTIASSSYRIGVSEIVEGDFFIAKYSGSAYQIDTFYIDSSRNVLIGATSATGTANQRLQVTGGAYVSGSVGIGTTNPSYKLDVQSSSNDVLSIKGGTNATFMVFDNNLLDDYKIGGVNVVAPFVVYNNTDARYEMVFDGTGNVLIGSQTATGTSSQTLQVTGGAYVSGSVGIGTTNPTTKLDVFVNGGEGLPANVTGERMRIISNDVVGRSGFLSIIAGSSAYSGVFFGDKDAADVGKIRYYHADNSLQFLVNGTTEAFRATSSGNVLIGSATSTGTASQNLQVTGGAYISGNVGIATTNPQYTLHVVGSFAATTKSFVIDHPTKPNYKLRYASLEGPENSVYVRGRTIENVIELPDYWTGLVDENSITVNLTPIGNKNVWVEEINNNKVYINSNSTIDCFYIVFAERKDVEKLVVEIPES